MREIEIAADRVVRFKANPILRWLVDSGRVDLNGVVSNAPSQGWAVEDMEEFWQLLGYSVSGFGDLDWVRPETVAQADEIAVGLLAHSSPVTPL